MTERDELGVALDGLEFIQAVEVIGVLARVNPKVITLPAVQQWCKEHCTTLAKQALENAMPPSPFFVTRYFAALNEIADYTYGIEAQEAVQAMRKIARKALGKV